MKLVQIENYIVRPTLDALTIPEIAEWFKVPTEGIRKLTYMYHMADFNSQFESYSDEAKHTKICTLILKDDAFEPDEELMRMVQMYRQEQIDESPTLYLYNNAKEALYKFAEYYKSIDFSEKDLKGQPVYRASEVANSLSKVGAMMKAFDDMKERVKKELFTTNNTKGGRAINKFER